MSKELDKYFNQPWGKPLRKKYKYKCLKCKMVWRSVYEHTECLNCESKSIEAIRRA